MSYPQRFRWTRSKFSDFGGDPPSPRCGHTAVCIGQSKVVFFGGFVQEEERYLNDVMVYDIGSRLLYMPNCSANGQAGPCPRAFHVAVAIGRKVFVIGGRSRVLSLNDVWVLDTDVWQWLELDVFGDVPCPREFSAASAIGKDKIIMFGGWQSKGHLSDLYLFNTHTLEWKEITVAGLVPPARCGHRAAVIDNKMMIYGGRNESILGDLWVLNGIVEEGEGAPAWTNINLPGQYLFPRYGHSMLSGENYLLLFGGGANEGWSNKCIILYRSTQWTILRTCNVSPSPRSYHSMTHIGPCFLLFGGFDGKNTLADLWWLVIEDDPQIDLDTNYYAELSLLKEMVGGNLDAISLVASCNPRIEAYIFKHFQRILSMAWFSWRKKPFHDMHITPPPRLQLRGDCAYEATTTVIECHFKMVYASRPPGQVRVFNVRLSAMHLKQMVHDYMHSKEGENAQPGDKLSICLLMAMRYGIVSEADWAAGCPPEAVRYKIKAYRQLSDVQKKKIPQLLEKCEAIVTTFKVTNEYLSLLPHDIYRYRAPDDLNGVIDLHERHCVVLTSTGYEFKEPDATGGEDLQQTAATEPPETYYEYMNSYSSGWGKDGCGYIYEDSLKKTYRIKIADM